ncbi:MAG: sigma 54-interacting transcriptional regulator [Pseudomonadota bacterium]
MEKTEVIPHILIIEEDEDACSYLANTLCRVGFDVTEVPNIASAQSAMGLWTPHAVIVNLHACMAALGASGGALGDGFACKDIGAQIQSIGQSTQKKCAVRQALQCIPASVPVLLLVDAVHFELLQYIDDSRIYTYVMEPIKPEEFVIKVRRACDYRKVCDKRDDLVHDLLWSRAHVEAIFRSVGDILVSVDAKGCVVCINDAGLNALQLERENVEEKPWQEVLQAWRGQLDDVLERALESRESMSRQRVVLRLDDGEELDFEVSASPFHGDKGEHFGAVLTMRDITRFVRAGLPKLASHVPNKYGLVGNSAAIRRVEYFLRDLAPTDTTVLILGESGTGKELVAEALHNAGPRATGPLVKVNCSALPETLLESELFGHVRGAFTGAVRDRVGRFQLAHGGTIFLDEIGEISPQVQLRLLRVLQEREFERVGDTKTTRVNVRVIAATNSNLRQLVAEGRFREDLYYRLRVVEVELPSLRERLEDVTLLAEHFISIFNQQFSRTVMRFTDAAMRCLLQYHWPGNVRELRHAVEHGFILCKDDFIDIRDLPSDVHSQGAYIPSLSHHMGLDKEVLLAALERTNGNKAKAARNLGISRQTLYRKIVDFGLE